MGNRPIAIANRPTQSSGSVVCDAALGQGQVMLQPLGNGSTDNPGQPNIGGERGQLRQRQVSGGTKALQPQMDLRQSPVKIAGDICRPAVDPDDFTGPLQREPATGSAAIYGKYSGGWALFHGHRYRGPAKREPVPDFLQQAAGVLAGQNGADLSQGNRRNALICNEKYSGILQRKNGGVGET